ncbi:hypothetical protein M407DRAFT_32846 [Tulasnella calospora MUT 4182]|uniref:Uncharacterized protein n=1 Tax=Tulasnella calospora MUT 4182 TaxID=1051891 RepID=A0A0C3K7U0_9AGAM|nr:hypothetical protein M407DRAFT_32846 [Tulasnella calospora MUT 4182]
MFGSGYVGHATFAGTELGVGVDEKVERSHYNAPAFPKATLDWRACLKQIAKGNPAKRPRFKTLGPGVKGNLHFLLFPNVH